MLLGFDHAIVAVGDLARTDADFRSLGFTVTARPDVGAEAARLARSGLPTYGPRSGGRALTDGRRWGVTVLLAGRGAGNPVLPFLIQDTEPHEVRVPAGAAAVQPHGATCIAGVTLLTAALAPVEAQLAAVFGAGTTAFRPGAAAARHYGFPGRWVEVIQPGADTPEMVEHLRVRGEGLYEVTLGRTGQTGPGDGELLPLASTHGARLRIGA